MRHTAGCIVLDDSRLPPTELTGRFFGPYSQVERPLLNVSNEPIPVGQITVAEFDKFRDAK